MTAPRSDTGRLDPHREYTLAELDAIGTPEAARLARRVRELAGFTKPAVPDARRPRTAAAPPAFQPPG